MQVPSVFQVGIWPAARRGQNTHLFLQHVGTILARPTFLSKDSVPSASAAPRSFGRRLTCQDF